MPTINHVFYSTDQLEDLVRVVDGCRVIGFGDVVLPNGREAQTPAALLAELLHILGVEV